MKSSKFNYLIPDNDGCIIFNGITEASFKISADRRDVYETIINNPNENYEGFRDFIDKMKIQGFIVEDDIDENILIKEKYDRLRCPGLYEMMILPTYQCNLRCWYCVQDHADRWLSDADVIKIKNRIKFVLQKDDIKEFHLAWFGGEPLLAYDRIVEITEWSQSLCKEFDKSFFATMTTNGTLLTKEKIEKLHELGFRSYQITIDGDKMTHNGIKVLGNNSAFDVTMSNIAEIAKHTHCTLRFNYTKENLKPDSIIQDIKERITEDVRKNINFFICKVWQESENNIDESEVKRLASMARELGINTEFQAKGLCYTDFYNFDCVFSNGKVGKCDNVSPDSNRVSGEICENGELIWEDENSYSLMDIFDPRLNATECMECKYLPVCWGPCLVKREDMMAKYSKVFCYLGTEEKIRDINMHKIIRDKYYNMKNSIVNG